MRAENGESNDGLLLDAMPPFRLEPTVRVLQRRATNRVDILEDGRYLRLLPSPDGFRLLIVEEAGTTQRPLVRLSVEGGPISRETLNEFSRFAERILGLRTDLAPIYKVIRRQPVLERIIPLLLGLKPPRHASLFETFANAIAFQQISLDAGVAIVGRFVERFGTNLEVAGERRYAFPAPEAIIDQDPSELRRVGFTMKKAMNLQAIARRIVMGDVSLASLQSLSTAAAVEALRALPGIGRWSAEVVLLRGLGRLDVFPVGDSGASKGLIRLFGVNAPLTAEQEQALLEPLGSYRGYLYFCLLGLRQIEMGLIRPVARA